MNAIHVTCPECEAELAPGARFCPRCGGFAGIAAPGPVPGGQQPVPQPQWPGGQQPVTQPQWPGGQQPVTQPQWPGGQRTVTQPVPWGGGRVPRAALPAAPAAAPPPAEPPADATRADWSVPTVTRQPGYPQPSQPFQQPAPPTRAEPARYQTPLLQGGPPPAFQPTAYAPGGYPQNGYQPTEYAPGGYPQNGYQPTEYAPGGYPQNGYQPQPAGGPGSFEPSPPDQEPLPAGGPPGAPRQPPRRHDRGRRGVPLALWVVLIVLLAGGAGAAIKLAHPFSHASRQGSAGTASAGASGSASGSPSASKAPSSGKASGTASAATEQQAAAGVAALLSQSAADRTATSAAANDIASCGPNLKTDPAVFGRAVTSRQALMSKLAALPGRATMPPAVLTDLANAWQASILADQAYVRWANDELAKKCVPQDTADPGYQATVAPNQDATTAKTQFAAAWKPVAAMYGLTQYQPRQL
jgi:hypothetical protein